MDWAISTCLVVFLSSLLSLLTDGTKLSSHINRVLGLVCLLAVFSPLITNLTKEGIFNISAEIPTQQVFLNYIENENNKKTIELVNNILIEQGITDNFNVKLNFYDSGKTIKSINIYIKDATKKQISSITGEITKKLNVDERIISICSE